MPSARIIEEPEEMVARQATLPTPTPTAGASDLATLGQKVKQAYPQYANLSDEALGMKFLAKYGSNDALVKAVTGQAGQPTGAEAVSETMRQGCTPFVTKGKTAAERFAIAEDILKSGGVKEYRKTVPLDELTTEKEREGLTASTELKRQIQRAQTTMTESLGGTGPLAQFIPGAIRSPEGREKLASVEQVRATYQQMVSGKVVSEQESERLKAFLPHKGKN